MRHPSYVGFYIWSIGTQLLLLNPACLLAYHLILKRFFRERVKEEEAYLRSFFGESWQAYVEKTALGLFFLEW